MPSSEQKILFVFPGQGSQYKGMGSDLCNEYPVAANIYQQAGEVLGYDIAELSFNDPEEKLHKTRYTQPALLTHSIACLEVFRDLTDDRLKPVMAAGHSLGEYSALVAAGALAFPDAVDLVHRRGKYMQEAVPVGVGAEPLAGFDPVLVDHTQFRESHPLRVVVVGERKRVLAFEPAVIGRAA